MTDIKEVGRQLMIQQYRLSRANQILRDCRQRLVQNKKMSDQIGFHLEACDESIATEIEQAKMEVILEFAQIIWELGPGEVDKWIAQKAAEAGVLEATARLTTKTFKRSLFNEELEDICTAEAHRRHVLNVTYTPPSEQQLEQLRKAGVVSQDERVERLEKEVNEGLVRCQDLSLQLIERTNQLSAVRDRLTSEQNVAHRLRSDVKVLHDKLEAAAEDRSDLLQANTLLGAWVQVFKGGNHGILGELLVESTEKYLP